MPELTVYTRRGCHLCEVLIEELMPLTRGRVRIHLRDVDRDPDLVERYGLRVPVLEADGRVLCEARLDRARVLEYLDQCGAPTEIGEPEPPGRL
jgi:thioredoxin reductase (NADPH)